MKKFLFLVVALLLLIPAFAEAARPTKLALKCPAAPFHCVLAMRLSGIINPQSLAAVSMFLDAAEAAGAEAVVLELNTPGGSYEAGFELARRIELAKTKVHCVADGFAYSMGFFVLQSCDVRVMTKRSILMAHEPFVRSNGGGTLTLNDILNLADDIKSCSRAYAEHVIKRMGLTLAQYRVHVSNNRDWYLDWETAIQFKAVDSVIDYVPNLYMARLLLGRTP